MFARTHIIHDLENTMVSGAHEEISEVLNMYRAYKGVEEVMVFNLKGQEVFAGEKSRYDAGVEEMVRTGEILPFDKTIWGDGA